MKLELFESKIYYYFEFKTPNKYLTLMIYTGFNPSPAAQRERIQFGQKYFRVVRIPKLLASIITALALRIKMP